MRMCSTTSTERDRLFQVAMKLSATAGEEYKGRWCFFAGFAFVLYGVEKRTYDIDVLTEDQETYQHITSVLQKIGMKLAAETKNFSSFKIFASDLVNAEELTLDLLCISSEWLKPLKGLWEALEEKEIDRSTLPVASPVHLILLKVLVNSHRQPGDKKKQQDLVDVRQLMSIRGITPEQVGDEAKRQELEDVTREFLDKLKATYPSG
jgi:hypothetical protein